VVLRATLPILLDLTVNNKKGIIYRSLNCTLSSLNSASHSILKIPERNAKTKAIFAQNFEDFAPPFLLIKLRKVCRRQVHKIKFPRKYVTINSVSPYLQWGGAET